MTTMEVDFSDFECIVLSEKQSMPSSILKRTNEAYDAQTAPRKRTKKVVFGCDDVLYIPEREKQNSIHSIMETICIVARVQFRGLLDRFSMQEASSDTHGHENSGSLHDDETHYSNCEDETEN